ncbi:AraC family transcriptional regulator [Phenylobacterium sp.]|jgi:AraC-like DNA-binding protein|uniref:AraC family transcriptional regulator n=1 Tax=Phenylobacterium sp. TaxID=1871053 RepID=UPI002E37D2E2|nr:AraC family transcriptional regulator [Phenylobacterium sp.]HEX3367481.1 AraC family transcriptional regulator [Phenylobacterium sp.]
MSHLARAAGLTGFVEVALSVGIDPYRIAAEAGVPAAALSDPDMRVASRAISLMYDLAAERSGANDFGLRIVETRRLSNLGPIALVIREQPTVRKALVQLARYIWLQNDAYSVEIEETGDIAVLRMNAPPWVGRQSAEISVGVGLRLLRELLGDAWRPQEISLTHAAPPYLSAYRRVYGMAPRFNQDFNGIVTAREDLDRPITTADPALARQMVRYLEEMAAGRGSSFGDKVREMILLLLPNGDCTVDRVAQRLAMDRRTLHRRLATEGETFSGLLNAARREAAEALLARSGRSFQAVAELVGFSSLSAFAHWFRRQFGCTASDYRARIAGGPGEMAGPSAMPAG